MARSYESNGPDVKIRGTPAHIAEKYITLARDAQSSGDRVLAENYLQHAEHYNRIIMAYREQSQQPGDGMNGNSQRMQPGGMANDGSGDFGDDDGNDMGDEGSMPQPPMQAGEPQPGGHGPAPARQERQERQERFDNGGERAPERSYDNGPRAPREPRNDRQFNRDRGDREQGQNRFRDRGPRNDRERGERFERPDRPADRGPDNRGAGSDRPMGEQVALDATTPPTPPRRRERYQPPVPAAAAAAVPPAPHEQPDFLRRPVRRARPVADDAAPPRPAPDRDGNSTD